MIENAFLLFRFLKMDEIGASQFYRKEQMVTCLPRNSNDLDGSSDSETDTNVTHSKKNKSEAGCVVAVDSERSDESGTE